MKGRALKKIAILAAPIIWRRIHARRRYWPRHRHHHWHGHHHCGHQGRRIWL